MKIYSYGIIDCNGEIPVSLSGIGEEAVLNVSYRDLGIAVSPLREDVLERIERDFRDHVMAHEKVVETLMQRFTVLPMKFCTVFSSNQEILSMMEGLYEDYREHLTRLRGKVEFGVKVIWPLEKVKQALPQDDSPAPASLAGSALSSAQSFLKERFRDYQFHQKLHEEADRQISRIDAVFARLAADRKLERLKTPALLLNAVYLVDQARQREFQEAFTGLRSRPEGLKYLLSGPWPPYHFITIRKSPWTKESKQIL